MYTGDAGQTVAFFNGTTHATVPATDLTTFTVAIWIKPVLGLAQYIVGADEQFFLHLRELGKFMARCYLNGDEFGPHGHV